LSADSALRPQFELQVDLRAASPASRTSATRDVAPRPSGAPTTGLLSPLMKTITVEQPRIAAGSARSVLMQRLHEAAGPHADEGRVGRLLVVGRRQADMVDGDAGADPRPAPTARSSS
jgi:hypothetical protein